MHIKSSIIAIRCQCSEIEWMTTFGVAFAKAAVAVVVMRTCCPLAETKLSCSKTFRGFGSQGARKPRGLRARV